MDRPRLLDDSEHVPVSTADAEHVREVERRRLRSLVDHDMAVAAALHADDYELVTPGGIALSKQEYLEAVESGDLDYSIFEAVSDVAVRMFDDAGIVRYQAHIEMSGLGQAFSGVFWHTDFYERRDGRWQAVWSQATRIPADPPSRG